MIAPGAFLDITRDEIAAEVKAALQEIGIEFAAQI